MGICTPQAELTQEGTGKIKTNYKSFANASTSFNQELMISHNSASGEKIAVLGANYASDLGLNSADCDSDIDSSDLESDNECERDSDDDTEDEEIKQNKFVDGPYSCMRTTIVIPKPSTVASIATGAI